MNNPAAELFRQTWSGEPEVAASAPGRANLIGEHTDYNGGPVLPMALEQRTWMAVRGRHGGGWRAVSALDGRIRRFDPAARMPASWTAYLVGAARALMARGAVLPAGAEIAVAGDVPVGAGLSSSAALTVAGVRALAALAGMSLSREAAVDLAWSAEHDHVGVACGRMDQSIAVWARRNHALLLETGSGARRQVPFARCILLIDTGRAHRLAGGHLNRRRAECESALARLRLVRPELASLAAISLGELDRLVRGLPAALARRVRHVVTETARTREAAAALSAGRYAAAGRLLVAGHASLRDDYESSCIEADWLVGEAVEQGAWGARLTGAGWGGTVVVLAPERSIGALQAAIGNRFRRRFGRVPRMWRSRAGTAARLER